MDPTATGVVSIMHDCHMNIMCEYAPIPRAAASLLDIGVDIGVTQDSRVQQIERSRKPTEYWGQHWTAWARLSAVDIVPRCLVLAGGGCARWRHETGAAAAGAAWEQPRHKNTNEGVPKASRYPSKIARPGWGGPGRISSRCKETGPCPEPLPIYGHSFVPVAACFIPQYHAQLLPVDY